MIKDLGQLTYDLRNIKNTLCLVNRSGCMKLVVIGCVANMLYWLSYFMKSVCSITSYYWCDWMV